MMKKLLFLMNPCAGQKKANRHLTEIISLFNSHNCNITEFNRTFI